MNNSQPQEFGEYWYNVSKELAEMDLAAELNQYPGTPTSLRMHMECILRVLDLTGCMVI